MVLRKKHYFQLGLILLFFVYVYSSDYIYGSALKVEGESKKSSTSVPPQNKDIITSIESIDVVKIKWKDLIRIQGWAVKPQQASSKNDYRIILKSKDNQLVYDTFNWERPDIYDLHKVKNSGFTSLIAKDAIRDGRYRIGIVNTNPDSQYLAYTDNYISKINSLFFDKFIGQRVNMEIPRRRHLLDFRLEAVQPITLKGSEFIRIQCFALATIDEDTSAYIVLNDGSQHLIYDAISVKRPDVVSAFKNPQLINSGVETYIPNDSFINGDYGIGILLVDNEASYAETRQKHTLP